MDAVISCNQLTKNYGRKEVLKGIDLQVSPGTIFALLGTNGAGKTSLIRTLLGLIPKTTGEVSVLGSEPYQFGIQLRERIGYVSEEQGLYTWMRVREIINFCKALYPRWDDTLTAQYLERFKLDLHAKIGTLSKGQTVKLALLLALAPKPDLLILDEPMTGLDPVAQHEFLQVILKDLRAEKRTVFFSTHNLADVKLVSEKVAILYDGQIRALGSIDEICQQVVKIQVSATNQSAWESQGGVFTGEADTLLFDATKLTTLSTPPPHQPATLEEAFLFFCSGGLKS